MKIIIDNYKLPSWNELYAGGHWIKRKKLADEAHELVHWAVYQTPKPKPLPFKKKVVIEYEIHYKDKRRRDHDNANVKLITDGLVLSGILADDSTKEIDYIKVQVKIGQPSNKVIINII